MQKVVSLFFTLILISILPAQIYKETRSVPLYPPSGASIISPGGRYFVSNTRDMDFNLMELGSSIYTIRSQYVAWTSLYPQYRKPDFRLFVFSPDEKYLITDNYVFDDSIPIPVNWVEIWDIDKRRIERQVAFGDERHDKGTRLTYNLEQVLRNYYNRSPFKNYSPDARIVFSPDGKRIFFVYPGVKVFSFPDWEEKTGSFGLVGVDKDKHLSLTFNRISAPVFFNNSSKIIMAVNGNTFIFNDFFDAPQDYYKIDGTFSHIEVSKNDKLVLFDNKLYQMDYTDFRTTFPGTAYLTAEGNRVMAGQDFYGAEANFTKLTPFYLGDGNFQPSSTREFVYLTSRQKRSFYIFSFSTGELLQTIPIEVDEFLLRDTDNGNMLLLKNKFTGKVRVFERIN